MNTWRTALSLMMTGALVLSACSDDSTSSGTGSGTASGTGGSGGSASGTSSGTSTGTPSGMAEGGAGGAAMLGACDPGNTLSPEQRHRETCAEFANQPAWGACAMDPTVAEAEMICATQPVCASCDYLWYGNTYENVANCLTELADLRCCAFANDAPMACNADGQSVYDQIDMNPACAVPYDAYVACLSN